MWQASAAYHDDHGPILLEKWNIHVRRQADRLIEELLNGVGDPELTVIELGPYALHARRCCAADEIRQLKSAWFADNN
jgi:hypothetical protein